MAIEKYQGKYVIAEDALNVIDMPNIQAGCKMIKDVSQQLSVLAKKVNLLKDYYNSDNLSIDSVDMEQFVDDHEKRMRDFSLYLSDLSETIMNTTQRVINRKQFAFNEEARILDEQQALQYQQSIQVQEPIQEFEIVEGGGFNEQ